MKKIGGECGWIALLVYLGMAPSAPALNPALDASQYAHTAWHSRDGFPADFLQAITQTSDGYLWLGAKGSGVTRYDGVSATAWQPPRPLPSDLISHLVRGRDGALWIGTQKGLVSWKDGQLREYPELRGYVTSGLMEDRDGTIWAGAWAYTSSGRLCSIRGQAVRCFGEDGRFGNGVIGLYGDRHGNLWAGTRNGVWRWSPGTPQFYPLPGEEYGIRSLTEDADGNLLIGLTGRVVRLQDGKPETVHAFPAWAAKSNPGSLLRDRDGGLWIATRDRGLLHVHHGRTDAFTKADGLSGDSVVVLYEDGEGNIWAATTGGLDLFREMPVVTYSEKQNLPPFPGGSVLTARDGSVWVNTADGLSRWNRGEVTVYHAPGRAPAGAGIAREVAAPGIPRSELFSLFEDHAGGIWIAGFRGVGYLRDERLTQVTGAPSGVVLAMAEDTDGGLWIANLDHGLIRIRGGRADPPIPWTRLNHRDHAGAMAADPSGGIWLGFFEGGAILFRDGQIRAAYNGVSAPGRGHVNDLRFDAEGTLWAATEGGLSAFRNGAFANLGRDNGLPCEDTFRMIEDDDHAFWLSMACGLVRIEGSELRAWLRDPKRRVEGALYDSFDGVGPRAGATGSFPNMAKALDGKIWLTTYDGVAAIDPHHLLLNPPPPVLIENVRVNGKPYSIAPGLRLPALPRDVWIDYTAPSLAAPEKVRFRYRLEPQDPEWKEVVNDREVQYSNLPPGLYRFRVTAANNRGVWNREGAALAFSIAPAYYQTNWFRASMVAVFFLALWALYRLRLWQISREFNAQLEGRVDERLRVARDLHDTLLQSFQGLIPVFQTARNLLPGQSDRAAEVLDEGLHDAGEAIVEGRNAIQNLRTKPSLDPDLGTLLNAAGQELAELPEAEGSAPAFRVVAEGPQQPLAPLLQDEIYRIGREMLRNAFRHAHASRIEAEVRYDPSMFRLRIRDDGKGIDSKVLKEGARAGHWGLPGIHERTKRMGGRLKIWSEPGAGTEAELTVPARIAYEKFSTSNGWWARLGRRLRLTAPNREA